MDQNENGEVGKKSGWARNIKVILGTVLYMIPLFYLWSQTGFPDDFGVRITAHGKGGALEHWWYSYLLLQRHRPLDLVLFVWMWAPVFGYVGWLIWLQLKKIRSRPFKFSIFNDERPQP